ncbi:hypothetical protein FE257_012662 [Aspergillus nanangensis]|uniref:Aminoglycoside phosphotransferase domain-containing protein n=1 Tax=Aspergillus nanangensis TaxID=2582783 RepID=A0AAD4CFR8_ASPNN|nr:hypothetical protein FE257_012662 [Aspergillus nanangensis]
MPQWWCGWEGCRGPAAQDSGDCLLCNRHLCRKHRRKPFHQCPTPEENWAAYEKQYQAAETRDIAALRQRINHSALCLHASKLRGGKTCSVELSHEKLSTMLGNQNCHAEITFEDDVRWLARFRLERVTSPPRNIRDWILQSEAATMIYLQRHTSIPSPKVFDWACESDPENKIGVGYILMEKLEGKPLVWQLANDQEKETVIQQLVDISLEIARHPFNVMGSLILSTDKSMSIQGLARPSTFRPEGGPIGPFSSPIEGWQELLQPYLSMISSGEVDTCCPVETYLMHRYRLDNLGCLRGDTSTEDQFFLRHPDDKGDHILVDDSFHIVGVIDWEWTCTGSKEEAFCSPCMMWPLRKFYEGSNELSMEELRLADVFRERNRDDLARCVIEGRKIQRFFFNLGPDGSYSTLEKHQSLFKGLQQALYSQSDNWNTWKSRAIEKWKEDSLLLSLLELE